MDSVSPSTRRVGSWSAGSTYSANFPVTTGPGISGALEAFLTRLTADGSGVYSSTLLTGPAADYGLSVAVGSNSVAYLAGHSYSSTLNGLTPIRTARGLNDGFVAAIAPDGTTSWMTFLGGQRYDYVSAAATSGGQIFLTGDTESADFPVTGGAADATCGTDGTCNEYKDASGIRHRSDTFFARLDTNGTITYATYLGGSGDDFAYALALDSAGRAYTAGDSGSVDFPAVQPLPLGATGGHDAFVTRFSQAGAVEFSTRIGGVDDETAKGLSVAGNIVTVTGIAYGAAFPLLNQPAGTTCRPSDAFAASFNAASSTLLLSSCFGGSLNDEARGHVTDGVGTTYLFGYTESKDLPVINGVRSQADQFTSEGMLLGLRHWRYGRRRRRGRPGQLRVSVECEPDGHGSGRRRRRLRSRSGQPGDDEHPARGADHREPCGRRPAGDLRSVDVLRCGRTNRALRMGSRRRRKL